MDKSKIKNALLKGEWLLTIAIFFQVIAVATFIYRGMAVGMNVYLYRWMVFASFFILISYAAVEAAVHIYKFVKTTKDLKSIIRFVVCVALLAAVVAIVIFGAVKYGEDFTNYFPDYNSTTLLGVIASVVAIAHVVAKQEKFDLMFTIKIVVFVVFAVIFIAMAYAKVENLMMNYSVNMLIFASLIFVLIASLMVHHKLVTNIISVFFIVLGIVLLLAASIIQIKKGYINMDLFNANKCFVALCALLTLVATLTLGLNETKLKQPLVKMVIYGVSVAWAVASVVLMMIVFVKDVNLVIENPSQMIKLSSIISVAIVGVFVALVSVVLNNLTYIESGVYSLAVVISLIVYGVKTSKVISDVKLTPYYKLVEAFSIELLVLTLVAVLYYVTKIIVLKVLSKRKSVEV